MLAVIWFPPIGAVRCSNHFYWTTSATVPALLPIVTRSPPDYARNPPAALDSLGERAVDNEVGAGNPAGHRACNEDDAGSDFLWRTHAPRRVERHRRLVEVRHAALDVLPDAALEIGVARRHRVDADTLGDQLVAEALGVMDQAGLESTIRTGGEIDLKTRHARDDGDRSRFRLFQIRH